MYRPFCERLRVKFPQSILLPKCIRDQRLACEITGHSMQAGAAPLVSRCAGPMGRGCARRRTGGLQASARA